MSAVESESLPSGLRVCKRCGEPRGWSGSRKSLCLCDGIVCRNCGYGKKRRPISDHYDLRDGKWWHTPYFAGHGDCWGCKERGRNRRRFEIQILRCVEAKPGVTPEEIAAEREDATTRKVRTALLQLQREKLIEEIDGGRWTLTLPGVYERVEGDCSTTIPEGRELQRYWKARKE